MASSSDAELTLPDGFPLAPKGCEKPSQQFFQCFTASGMQKDGVAVRSQRPKNKVCERVTLSRAAGRGRRRARPRGVRGAARRVPQVPRVARTKTAAAGRVPRARGVPARRRRVRRARVTTTPPPPPPGSGQYNVVVSARCVVRPSISVSSMQLRLACEDTLELLKLCVDWSSGSSSVVQLSLRNVATDTRVAEAETSLLATRQIRKTVHSHTLRVT